MKDEQYVGDETAQKQIEDLLLGRRVVEVHLETGHALLDDGTQLRLVGNDGGCACSAGCYGLTALNRVDNVITAVEFQDQPGGDDFANYEGVYQIFVFAGDERINLATFEGTDGNGYYGTGYQIYVKRP